MSALCRGLAGAPASCRAGGAPIVYRDKDNARFGLVGSATRRLYSRHLLIRDLEDQPAHSPGFPCAAFG